MTRNEGNLDRIVRIVAGVGLGAFMLTGVVTGVLGWLLLAVGTILIVTGATGFCPLYALFGVRTKGSRRRG